VPSALKTIIFPVGDLASAKGVLAALLGSAPVVDQPYYVQFNDGEQEIGLDPNGASKGMTGPVPYWHVSDIKQTLHDLVASGAREDQPINDFGGRLVASVRDADGNPIGLIQPA